jgi:putative phosphoribosyl transferase
MTQNPGRTITISEHALEADLVVPPGAEAIIIFAHGSGSRRHSTRNQYVAQTLNDAGLATLLVDLLTTEEKTIDEKSRHLRFDIDLLSTRLLAVTQWVLKEPETRHLKIGYFGSSTGAAAAFIAAAKLGDRIKAVVSRGGRPDLADSINVFEQIVSPTLLIVGGNDIPVIGLNKSVLRQLKTPHKELVVVPGAGHLFEEPGKMEIVAASATKWFKYYLLGNGKAFESAYSDNKHTLFSFFKMKPNLRFKFKDRLAAGNLLASILSKYASDDNKITVMGIPRGGLVVASVVAAKLAVDLDIVVPRKLRSPDNSENAIGAIMHDGSVYIDNRQQGSTYVSDEYLRDEKLKQTKEIKRRLTTYRSGSQEYNLKDGVAILVDDGAASGATAIISARWIKNQKPKKLIVAMPVASPDARKLLEEEADEVEVILCPSDFKTVENSYQDFSAVTDETIIKLLRRSDTVKS